MSNICEEVIAAEILTRLPVKSLLKFRCVSKLWCYLISCDKVFVKSHLENSKNKKSLISSFRGRRLKQYPLEWLFEERTSSAVEGFVDLTCDFEQLSLFFNCNIYLVGSCNGLCCLQPYSEHNKRFFLWNPATKLKSRPLPQYHYADQLGVGFGFDGANNDYKILSICDIFVDIHLRLTVKVFYLYSLSTNSWKQVEPKFPFTEDFLIPCHDGKFLNGKLHFCVLKKSGNKTYHILSFDLESEVFGLVNQPKFEDDNAFRIQELGVLDGCLSCTMVKNNMEGDIEVWVMKEYGIEDSWYLLAVISDSIDGVVYSKDLKPIHMSQGGEILLVDNSGSVVIYNLKTEKGRFLQQSGYHLCSSIYVESLVSPVHVPESEMRPMPMVNWH